MEERKDLNNEDCALCRIRIDERMFSFCACLDYSDRKFPGCVDSVTVAGGTVEGAKRHETLTVGFVQWQISDNGA